VRVKIVSAIISILFINLIVSLAYTQIVRHGQYVGLSSANRIRLIPMEGLRGQIYDRNGVVLVGNRSSFDVVVIPQELERSVKTLSRVGQILGILPEEVFKRVEKNYMAPFVPVSVREDVERQKAMMLEEESLDLPGVMVKVTPKREYKFKEAGSHIFGYLGEIDKTEFDRLRNYGYQIRDLLGKSGLEKNYDNYLRGEEGGMQLEVNNRGYLIKAIGKKEATRGKDLFLTIDIRLQKFIEELLLDKISACVIMVPGTGEILALVSKPNFDPDVFINKERRKERADILEKADRPMLNRAISGLYPPGSVFKPIVAIAALERKKITPHTEFFCGGEYVLGGRAFKCWDEEGHGSQDVREGLKNSCNAFFYQVGRLVGVEDIFSFATRFGYGTPTGVDLPEEAAGLVPNKMWKRIEKKESWFEGETLNFAIGQGYLLVTPIQVARMMAAIANGGVLVQPYIVKRINDIEISTGRGRDLGISNNTLREIRIGLEKVVEDEHGTGKRARVEGLRIAGKTGTAQNPRGPSHAWFSGFSPVDNPKIVLVVFIEHGKKGGLEAAESAGKIFEEAKRLGLL
jgi:penicillin-binding protein 2